MTKIASGEAIPTGENQLFLASGPAFITGFAQHRRLRATALTLRAGSHCFWLRPFGLALCPPPLMPSHFRSPTPYLFENWKRFRAPGCPYFLRSFMREARVRNPSFFKTPRNSVLRSEEHTSELQSRL